jgi:hypothetical protein
MNQPTCPTCGQPGVQQRTSKNGRPYLAHVQTYDSGRSYFRRLHTAEACAAYAAEFAARVAAEVTAEQQRQADHAKGLRAQVLIPRYKAIFGAEVLSTEWTRVAARWLP